MTCGRSVVSYINKTDRHDLTEILLKVALKPNQPNFPTKQQLCHTCGLWEDGIWNISQSEAYSAARATIRNVHID
jgi:hypothetical protein